MNLKTSGRCLVWANLFLFDQISVLSLHQENKEARLLDNVQALATMNINDVHALDVHLRLFLNALVGASVGMRVEAFKKSGSATRKGKKYAKEASNVRVGLYLDMGEKIFSVCRFFFFFWFFFSPLTIARGETSLPEYLRLIRLFDRPYRRELYFKTLYVRSPRDLAVLSK